MVLLCEVPKILILIDAAAWSVGLDFHMADSWLSDFVPSSSSQGDAVWCEAAFLGTDVCKAGPQTTAEGFVLSHSTMAEPSHAILKGNTIAEFGKDPTHCK